MRLETIELFDKRLGVHALGSRIKCLNPMAVMIKGILRVQYATGQLGRRKGERRSFLIRLRQVLGRVLSEGSGVKSSRTT